MNVNAIRRSGRTLFGEWISRKTVTVALAKVQSKPCDTTPVLLLILFRSTLAPNG